MKALGTFGLTILYYVVSFAQRLGRWVSSWVRGRGTSVLFVHPQYRELVLANGLTSAEDFLDMEALIVSGHRDRNVGKCRLEAEGVSVSGYLKREHHVGWSVRLANFFGGYGFCSRCLKELALLQAAERHDIGCPQWIAAGEDDQGRAFVLVRQLEDATELRKVAQQTTDPVQRSELLKSVGTAVAHLHRNGFDHPDLYSKHVYVADTTGEILFLDWQRATRDRSWSSRVRSLATLVATLPESAFSRTELLCCWRVYCHELGLDPKGARARTLARALLARSTRLLEKRHVREKRETSLDPRTQNWTWVDGERLSVTSHYDHAFPTRAPHWLVETLAPVGVAPTSRIVRTEGGLARHLQSSRGRTSSKSSDEERLVGLMLRLQRHGVSLPNVLAQGRNPNDRAATFCLLEEFDNCLRLDLWLERTSDDPTMHCVRNRVLSETGELLAKLHRADSYFRTEDATESLVVLRPESEVATPALADARGIAVESKGVSENRTQRDVARLLRALSLCCRADELEAFLRGYRDSSRPGSIPHAVSLDDVELPEMESAAEDWQDRTTLGTFWRRLRAGIRSFGCSSKWARLLGSAWIERIMDVEVTDRFFAKQGRSTGRLVLDSGDERCAVYLKRHYKMGWWNSLLALLFPSGAWSPATQESRNLEWARQHGIPVPRTVAVGEFVGPGLRFQSFLAVEELTGMIPLHEAIPEAQRLLDADGFRRWKRSLVAEVARLCRMLHDRDYFHKDLYLCHFFIAEEAIVSPPKTWRGQVYLIDLHRLAHHRWTSPLWLMKDLAQLMFSSDVDGIDDWDRAYFWREYNGHAVDQVGTRLLRTCILFKWRNYRRHNDKKVRTRAEDIPPDNPHLTASGPKNEEAA